MFEGSFKYPLIPRLLLECNSDYQCFLSSPIQFPLVQYETIPMDIKPAYTFGN